MIIYKLTNKINNKIYIGQTIHNLNKRLHGHRHNAKRFKYGISAAIAKYGFDNFTSEIICHCFDLEELDKQEKYFIQEYQSNDSKIGYNLTAGGEGLKNPSAEVKQKMSNAHKNPNRKTTKGYKFTEEQKHNLSVAHLGISPPNKGIPMSEEQRMKLKVYWKSLGIPIICNETNLEYTSITEAAKIMNIDYTAISKICKGKQKQTKNGYTFRYKHLIVGAY